MTTARLGSQIDQLELSDLRVPAPRGANAPAAGVWREQRLSLNLNGSYNGTSDLLTVDKGEIDSEALRCQATGQVAAVTASRNLDLRGKVDYDWAALAPLWRLYAPDGMQIAGRGSREFFVRGPFPASASPDAWAQLAAEAGLDWSSAELYGLRIGQGELSGKLADGVMQFKPLELDVSGGHVSLLPQLRLASAPAELRLARSALVHEVQITPEVCAQALKFVAPVVAEATVAEGTFSIDLNGGHLPLADPAAGDVSGRLVVKSVQVKPGPMAEQLIIIGKEIAAVAQKRPPGEATAGTLLKMDNQNVDFRLVNRRVYHQGLTFLAGNVQITTHGSVGIDDESLAIMAEVPMQDSWLGGNPALKNQTAADSDRRDPEKAEDRPPRNRATCRPDDPEHRPRSAAGQSQQAARQAIAGTALGPGMLDWQVAVRSGLTVWVPLLACPAVRAHGWTSHPWHPSFQP